MTKTNKAKKKQTLRDGIICDSINHNEYTGCSNPSCFKYVPYTESDKKLRTALAGIEKPKQSDEELAREVLDGLTMLKNSRDPYGDMQKRITQAFAKVRQQAMDEGYNNGAKLYEIGRKQGFDEAADKVREDERGRK